MTSPGTRVSHEAAVLIVEDGPLVRAFAADILMDAGYRVFEACEAADALTILEGRGDIGTVFTDIEMSGMRSEEHTSELQSLMRISYAVFCLKKKISRVCNKINVINNNQSITNTQHNY